MIIKEEIKILNNVMWKVYSDNNKYIKNVRTGIEYTVVNTCINDEFIETHDIEED